MGKSIHSFTISMHCQDDDDDARHHDKESQGPPSPPSCDQRSKSLDFPERNLAQVISIIKMVMANSRFILRADK